MLKWAVEIGDEFEPEFRAFREDVQTEILALTLLLETVGPNLGRPHVDTLKNSRYANMKELRFSVIDGVWRVAFAFDTRRRAILLVAGDKSGGGEKRFYRDLIHKAEKRFEAHLDRLKKGVNHVHQREKNNKKTGPRSAQKGKSPGRPVDRGGNDSA